jgi:hypothetical protein
MTARIAHFRDLKPIDYASFIKNYKPDGTQGYALIGRAGTTVPAIAGEHGFTMAVNKLNPGKGAPLHSHPKPEVFVVLAAPANFSGATTEKMKSPSGRGTRFPFPPGRKRGSVMLGTKKQFCWWS